ncbi:hypothetical protein PGTUg99_036197 [Puccinia graminis f. sp. tritici]|nr:hypothetical protein PGTUg99_036197 [Puccinia graminis f. sp. tritici]
METEVITSSQADKIALERLNWFSRRSAGTIWWKAGLVGKADPRISDDIGLITIGDILRFGNEEQAMKLTNKDVEKMFRELKQVSLKNIHASKRAGIRGYPCGYPPAPGDTRKRMRMPDSAEIVSGYPDPTRPSLVSAVHL